MIVTLSGSVRFEQEFIDAQRELSRGGINFLSLAVLPQHRRADEDWSDGSYEKIIADLLYFDRILHSDAVVVLGDGYIGFSTAREILWADIQGKPVYWHAARHSSWLETLTKIKRRSPTETAIVEKARAYFRPKVDGQRHPFGFNPAEDIPNGGHLDHGTDRPSSGNGTSSI